MRARARGLLLAGLQLLILASLGARLLVERALRPRVWVRAEPVDPELPMRGRYVRLRVELPPGPGGTAGAAPWTLAYFIPERVPDPSRRAPGEELWVEVTLPRRGPPRPIRLAVKRDGKLAPLS